MILERKWPLTWLSRSAAICSLNPLDLNEVLDQAFVEGGLESRPPRYPFARAIQHRGAHALEGSVAISG